MIARKKLTAFAVLLSLLLLLVFGVAAAGQVYAEETGTAVSDIQDTQDTQDTAADTGSKAELNEEEIPLAEAKASVFETQEQTKGMHSFLAFLIVAGAAAVTGGAVALRAKFGSSKKSYVHADDLTIFRGKK